MQWLQNLNKDQLNSLSKFCLDLAKGALVFAVFSPSGKNWTEAAGKISSIFSGIALVAVGMLLLKMKRRAA